jgi:hypothetical protein
VVENKAQKRIFRHKIEEITGDWRDYLMNSSPNIITVIMTRINRWAGQVAHMG